MSMSRGARHIEGKLDRLMAESPAEKAAGILRDWIFSGKLAPGRKLPSERELEKALNTSRVSVRAALKALEAEGLVRAEARRARFVVWEADASSHSVSNSIGVIIAEGFAGPGMSVGRPSWLGILHHSILHENMGRGFSTLFVAASRVAVHRPDAGSSRLLRAIIQVAPVDGAAGAEFLRAALAAPGAPVAALGDEAAPVGADLVFSDHETGSCQLTRWLVERGARRLLRCRPPLGRPDWLARRDAGFERALTEAGIAPLPVLEIPGLREAGEDAALFEQMSRLVAGHLADKLRGDNAADAILAASDGTVGIMNRACRILGLEPGRDVLVAGYDNYWRECPETRFEPAPPAVTVDKQDALLGATLAGLVHDRLSGKLPAEPQRIVVAQKLVPVTTS